MSEKKVTLVATVPLHLFWPLLHAQTPRPIGFDGAVGAAVEHYQELTGEGLDLPVKKREIKDTSTFRNTHMGFTYRYTTFRRFAKIEGDQLQVYEEATDDWRL